jgi:hypothetical protein
MRKSTLFQFFLAVCSVVSFALTSQAQFSGSYAPANWSTVYVGGGNGSMNTANAPTSITMTGNDNVPSYTAYTRYQIPVCGSGTISFSWSLTHNDPGYDEFGYWLNNTYNYITNTSGSGTVSVSVSSGQTFGFYSYGSDGCCGTFTVVLSNFSGPSNACTNPVAPGNTNGPSSACPNQPFDLTLSNGCLGSGVNYQWQSSANGSSWSNISGATSASYSASQTTAKYYRCAAQCGSGTVVYSTALYVAMNSYLSCYCTPSTSYGASSGYYGHIANVQFNQINNSSSWATASPYYTEYPTSTATTIVFTDQTYELKVNSGLYNHAGAWIDWNQDGTFATTEFYYLGVNSSGSYWNGIQNITVPATALTGMTKLRIRGGYYGYSLGAGDACTTLQYGETEDYFITVIQTPQNDAGIQQLINPGTPTCDFDSVDVTVSLNNWGSNTLTTCSIKWQINSGTVNSYSYSGSVPAYGNGFDTVILGNANFSTNDILRIWTESPNGAIDSISLNDSATVTTISGLSGTYTIPGDYASITAARDALVSYGVCDDVIFNIASGTYTEQVEFPDILGTSENATITFQSANGNPNSVKIVQSSTSNTNNYVIAYRGADWLTFQKLTIKNSTSGTYSNAVAITNGSHHATLNECVIKAGPSSYTGAGDYSTGVYINGINNFATISGNRIEGGSCNIYWFGGSTTSQNDGLTLTDNEIKNSYFYTIYGYYGKGLEMHGNTVTNDSAMYTYAYGPFFNYVDKFNVSNNYVGTNMNYGYYYGFYLAYGVGYNSPRSLFANNCIYAGSSTATSYGYYGLYMYGTGNTDVHHNSVTRKGQSNYQYAYAGYFGQGGNISLKNNIFNDQSGCIALYAQGGFTIAESDHNSFYSTNATPFYFGNGYVNSLSAYQQLSDMDEHSVFLDPEWQGILKCITCNDTIGNGGAPVATNTDIDGNARSLTNPDIGAVEFVTPGSFTLGGDDTICSDQITLEAGPAPYVAWSVLTNGAGNVNYSTPSITLTQQGGLPTVFDVSVTIITAYCGSGSDVATITLVPDPALDSNLHICSDETATLSAGGGSSATYGWSTGATTSSIDINESGSYSVLKSEMGCESEATIIVTQSVGVNIANVDACEDDGPVNVNASIPGGVSYAWSGGSSTSTASNQFNADGNYSVTATDSFGCVSVDDFDLFILGEPTAGISHTNGAGTAVLFSSAPSQEVGSNTSYSWLFNSVDVSTLPNPVYVFPWSGNAATYPVTLEVNNGCGVDTKTINIKLDPLGLDEISASGAFDVYPNPAEDVVLIKSAFSYETLNVSVFDNAGRKVLSNTTSTHSNVFELNVSELASGTYMLNIVSESTSETHTLIKL